MSNILTPIAARYRAFFTVVMFSSSRLVRSAHAGQLVQQLVIDAQHTYQALVLNKQRAIASKYTQYQQQQQQTALYRNSSKSSSTSSSSATSSPGRSTLSSLDTAPSTVEDTIELSKDGAHGGTLQKEEETSAPTISKQPSTDALSSSHHQENHSAPSAHTHNHVDANMRVKSSTTLMSLALACIFLGLLQARRRNLKRMRRLLRNSQRLSKRSSRVGNHSAGGPHSASTSQQSTPSHSLTKRSAISRPTMPFGLERIPSESRVNAWLEDLEQQQQIQPHGSHIAAATYQHPYPQYPEQPHQHQPQVWQQQQHQAQCTTYPIQPQPYEQYQSYEQQEYYSSPLPRLSSSHPARHQLHPAMPVVVRAARMADRQSWYSSHSHGYQYSYSQPPQQPLMLSHLQPVSQQYPQYQHQQPSSVSQYVHQATTILDHDYDHTPGHRRSLSLTNVGSTFKPIRTSPSPTPAPQSPTAQSSLLPHALEPEALTTGAMSPAELAREQHRLHRERYQLHHQQLKQQQQQQSMPSPLHHQHYYHRSTSPVPMAVGGGGCLPVRGMSPPPLNSTTIFPLDESSSISQKRTAQQLAWERHHYYQQQQFEEDARAERDAYIHHHRYHQQLLGNRPVSMIDVSGSGSIARSMSDGWVHHLLAHHHQHQHHAHHHQQPQQQYGMTLHVDNKAVRTSSLSRSVASSLSPQTAQALGIQRARTTGSGAEKRWSGWFIQRTCKNNSSLSASFGMDTSNGGGMIERVIRKASLRFRKGKTTPPTIDVTASSSSSSLSSSSRFQSLAGDAHQAMPSKVSSVPLPSLEDTLTVSDNTTTITPLTTATDAAEVRRSMTTFRSLSPSLPSLRNLARRCTLTRPKSFAAPSNGRRHYHSMSVLALEALDTLPMPPAEESLYTNYDTKEGDAMPLGAINARTKARHQCLSMSESSLAVLKEKEADLQQQLEADEKQQGQHQQESEIKYYPPTGVAINTVDNKEKPRVHRRVTLHRSQTLGRSRLSRRLMDSSESSSSLMLPGFGESMRLANGKGVEFSSNTITITPAASGDSLVSSLSNMSCDEMALTMATSPPEEEEEARRTREQVAAILTAVSRRGGTPPRPQHDDQHQPLTQTPTKAVGDQALVASVDPYADIAFMLVPKSKYAFQPLASAAVSATATAATAAVPVMDHRQTCSVMGN